MTPLRHRMLEDMPIRNLASSTPRAYVEHVSRFARHFGRSPARCGPQEIRADQVYLTTEQQLAPASMVITVPDLETLCVLESEPRNTSAPTDLLRDEPVRDGYLAPEIELTEFDALPRVCFRMHRLPSPDQRHRHHVRPADDRRRAAGHTRR